MKTLKQFRQMVEGLMYQGKASLPKTKKPENTVKSATTGGHKTFQKRASRKIGQRTDEGVVGDAIKLTVLSAANTANKITDALKAKAKAGIKRSWNAGVAAGRRTLDK
jgi:hypothetical protein